LSLSNVHSPDNLVKIAAKKPFFKILTILSYSLTERMNDYDNLLHTNLGLSILMKTLTAKRRLKLGKATTISFLSVSKYTVR
jgi:hypothetical protein